MMGMLHDVHTFVKTYRKVAEIERIGLLIWVWIIFSVITVSKDSRLSKEDIDKYHDVSLSVENQITTLENYVKENIFKQ